MVDMNKKWIVLTLLVLLIVLGGVLIYSRDDTEKSRGPLRAREISPVTLKYAESSADFSYVLVSVEELVDINFTDEKGIQLGDVVLEEPISDPAGEATSNAEALNSLYYQKPESGTYYLRLSSPESFNADIYFYDREGRENVKNIKGVGNEDYVIKYDKENSSNSTVFSQR